MRLSLLLFVSTLAPAADISSHFQNLQAAFILKDSATKAITVHNPARAKQRFPPCSTFKIPNTLIALETKTADGPDFLIPYDPALKLEGRGPNGAWGKDNTLRSAYQNSVLWFYQALARRAGLDTMTRYVRQFQYGNADTSGGVDRFWIDGTLQISPEEQIAFLERLNTGRLGLKPATTATAKNIMLADSGPGWKLYAKTGACRETNQPVALWYVGFIERGNNTHYFALEIEAPDYEPLMHQRIPIARAILTELKLIGQ
ncbi:MAG: class D beta-lactamase [Bryobacterales bacterium]|nr:class D beta-lactamase [Bryobacterales bacterium]